MAARSLSLREKRLIQVAILLVIVVLLSLLLRGGGTETPVTPPSPVRPVPARSPVAVTPAVSVPPAPVAMAPAPAPVAPVAGPSGLRLHGLLASGAVISTANAGQRLVPVGREVVPGLTLVRIEQNHAVLSSGGGEIRLGFDGTAPVGAVPAPAPPSPAPAGTSAQR